MAKLKVLMAALALALLAPTALSFADDAGSQSLRELEKKFKGWDTAFVSCQGTIQYYHNQMDFEFQSLDSQLRTLALLTDSYNAAYYQLRFLIQAKRFKPNEFRNLSFELMGINGKFSAAIARVEEKRNGVEKIQDDLRGMRRQLSQMAHSDERLFSLETLDSMDALFDELDLLDDECGRKLKDIDVALARTKELRQKLQAMEDDFRKQLMPRLRQFLFNFRVPLGSSMVIKSVPMHVLSWVRGAGGTAAQLLPEVEELPGFFGFLALAAALSFGLALLGRRAGPDLVALGKHVACAVCAGGYAATAHAPSSTFFQGVAFAFVFAGLARLVMACRRFLEPETPPRGAFRHLFYTFLLFYFTQFLDLDLVMLGLTRLLIVASMPLAIWPQLRKGGLRPIDRNIMLGGMVLAVAEVILFLFGYLFLGSIIFFCWFIISIGTLLSDVLSKMLQRGVSKFPETPRLEFLKVLLLGLGIPLIWSVVIVLSACWILRQMGISADFLAELVNYDVYSDGSGMRVSLFKTALAVFLFFVFLSTHQAIHTYFSHASVRAMRPGLASFGSLFSYAGWAIYTLLVLKIANVSIAHFGVILGGLSVGIGFGLQTITNNFVSGILLQLGRTVKAGDIIDLDGEKVTVQCVNIRSTVIKSNDNAIVTLPNSDLITRKVVNWTKNDRTMRSEVSVGVDYESDVELVRQTLFEAAASVPGILSSPMPSVLLANFGASTIDFTLRVWIDEVDDRLIRMSALRFAIAKKFAERGVVIAYNQLDLRVKELPARPPRP